MKKGILLFTCLSALFIQNRTFAQAALPYYTGFDTPAEKAGWLKFGRGFIGSYPWDYHNSGFSAPNCIYHDYNVGAGGDFKDTIKDWYVSPAISFFPGGKISLKVKGFTMGTIQPADYFGIWLSIEDANPSDGKYVELADLTSFSLKDTWKDTTITLPQYKYSGNSYYALVYKSTWNWFTIGVDNISINKDPFSGIENNYNSNLESAVSPNPFNTTAILSVEKPIKNGVLSIYDLLGKEVKRMEGINESRIIIEKYPLKEGIYFYQLKSEAGLINGGKIIIE